ncbi:Pleckstrin y domain [Balamuthia mandrillaris]
MDNFKKSIERKTSQAEKRHFQLDLSKEKVGAKEAEVVKDVILPAQVIQSLAIDAFRLGDDGAIVLAELLKEDKTLNKLVLTTNATQHLANSLTVGEERRDITRIGGAAIGDALLINTTLRYLDLSGNTLHSNSKTTGALASIARALSANRTLTHLDLSSNQLNSVDAISLAKGLQRNHALTFLAMERNYIQEDGHLAIASALKYNATLAHLYLSHAQLKTPLNAILDKYLEVMEFNETLVEIKLPKSPCPGSIESQKQNLLSRRLTANKKRAKQLKSAKRGKEDTTPDPSSSIPCRLDWSYYPPQSLTLQAFQAVQGNTIRQLILIGCGLTSLPEDFCCNLLHIDVLDLHNNKLTTLPHSLTKLKKLRLLDLSHNHLGIDEHDPNHAATGKRRVLPLSNNSAEMMAEMMDGDKHFPLLLELYLNNNSLKQLPWPLFWVPFNTETGQLQQTALPLPNLRRIDLSFNSLRRLPESFFNKTTLPKLHTILAEHNQLCALPHSIVSLPRLSDLWVSSNLLDYVPIELGEMDTLQVLKIKDNPLWAFPAAIHDATTEAQKSYFKKITKNSRAQTTVKLMVVGEANVGKTSLITCFAPSKKIIKKKSKEPNIATDGIDIATFEDEDVQYNAWDFAGQDLYQVTHQFFLSKRAIYVLVFNLALWEEPGRLAKVEYWLNSLSMRAKGCPVVIVGTHLDHKNFRKERTEYAKEILQLISERFQRNFPDIVLCTGVSCKTGKGIAELKTGLHSIAQQKGLVGVTGVPATWLLLSEWAKRMKKKKQDDGKPPIMKYASFRQKALDFDVPADEVNNALHFLHEIGDVLYFGFQGGEDQTGPGNKTRKDHKQQEQKHRAELSELVFLDPQWLTDVLSTVVTMKYNMVKDGTLMHKDLHLIWKPPMFPPSLHPTLLNLLRKFEIIYPMHKPGVPPEEEVSLVPCLLDKQRPFQINDLWPCLQSPAAALVASSSSITAVDGEVEGTEEISSPEASVAALTSSQQLARTITSEDATTATGSIISNTPHPLQTSATPSSIATTVSPIIEAEGLQQMSRIYYFSFLPLGFFSRLFVRTIHLEERIPDLSVLSYWTNGIILCLKDTAIKAYLEYLPELYCLRMMVRRTARDNVRDYHRLHGFLIASIDGLVEGWFKGQLLKVTAGCPHCFHYQRELSHEFSISDIEKAVAQGHKDLPCGLEGRCSVRLDYLAPDISLVDVRQYMIESGQVEMEEMIGRGSFANVYRGKYKGQTVAVKKITITQESGGDETELLEKFKELRREVLFMSGLRHPYTVELKGICMQPLLIVTEYLAFGNLYEFLHAASSDVDWNLRLKIARDVAVGMNFLHSATPPVVHGDLKSPNILLASNDPSEAIVAKVADFGLSTQLTSSQIGRQVSNYAWLPPEILTGGEYNEKADVYGFGIILWELLTRAHPFAEYQAEYAFSYQLEDAIVAGLRPTFPEATHPHEQQYIKLIMECWDKAPDNRPSFDSIVARLSDIRANLQPTRPWEAKEAAVLEKSTLEEELDVEDESNDTTQKAGGAASFFCKSDADYTPALPPAAPSASASASALPPAVSTSSSSPPLFSLASSLSSSLSSASMLASIPKHLTRKASSGIFSGSHSSPSSPRKASLSTLSNVSTDSNSNNSETTSAAAEEQPLTNLGKASRTPPPLAPLPSRRATYDSAARARARGVLTRINEDEGDVESGKEEEIADHEATKDNVTDSGSSSTIGSSTTVNRTRSRSRSRSSSGGSKEDTIKKATDSSSASSSSNGATESASEVPSVPMAIAQQHSFLNLMDNLPQDSSGMQFLSNSQPLRLRRTTSSRANSLPPQKGSGVITAEKNQNNNIASAPSSPQMMDGAIVAIQLVDNEQSIDKFAWIGLRTSASSFISIWNLSNNAHVKTLAVPNCAEIYCVMDTTCNTVWTGTSLGINVWDQHKHKLKKKFKANEPTSAMACIDDTVWCVHSSTTETSVIIRDQKTCKKINEKEDIILEGMANVLPYLCKAGRNVWIACGNTIFVFDAQSRKAAGNLIGVYRGSPIRSLVSQQDQIWICSEDGTIQVWTPEGQVLNTIQGHCHGLECRGAALNAYRNIIWGVFAVKEKKKPFKNALAAWETSSRKQIVEFMPKSKDKTSKEKDKEQHEATEGSTYEEEEEEEKEQERERKDKTLKEDTPVQKPCVMALGIKTAWTNSCTRPGCIQVWKVGNRPMRSKTLPRLTRRNEVSAPSRLLRNSSASAGLDVITHKIDFSASSSEKGDALAEATKPPDSPTRTKKQKKEEKEKKKKAQKLKKRGNSFMLRGKKNKDELPYFVDKDA